MADKYESVNGAWPSVIPALTGQEAASAARRLYRLAMGKPFAGRVEITSGNRFTWIRHGVLYVNPSRTNTGHVSAGWNDIVHCMSHYCHGRLYPKQKPHGGNGTHAWIERTMIEHVVRSGWLEGRLKRPDRPQEAANDTAATKLAALNDRLAKWESKARRADRAIKKIKRRLQALERRAATQAATD